MIYFALSQHQEVRLPMTNRSPRFRAATRQACSAFVLLAATFPAAAQVTGTISGYVKDPSGAVVARANITATLEDQSATRTAVSDETGFYNLLAMPRGKYSVTVTATGFSTKSQAGIELTAGANVRLDFDLTVGAVADKVQVTASTPMVETTTATSSSLVDDRRVQDLPLNGRNVVGLAAMMSEVSAISTSQTMGDSRAGPVMSVNGSNQNSNFYTLNGATFINFDQTNGFDAPPPDAIQEIHIQTHSFPAEYGFTSGAQVSMVTKAGTNDFHGSAWEFWRNSVLNARSFFQPIRPFQNQNQAGVAGGGPLRKNKLFLFGSYQRLWQRQQAGSSVTTVPTAAMRSGDFTGISTTLKNPVNPVTGLGWTTPSGAPCVSGNIIAPACISKAAQNVLNQYVPTAANNSVVTLSPAPWNNYNWLWRADYNLGSKDTITATFNFDHTDTSSMPANLSYLTQSIYTNILQGSIHDVHTFSPTFLNEGLVSYTYNRAVGGPDTQITPASMGINLPPDPAGRGVTLSISGGPNLVYPNITYQYYNSFDFHDTVTWIRGRHTMKFGFQFIQYRFYYGLTLTRSLSFSGIRTGNAMADFVLGAYDTGAIWTGATDNTPKGWKHALFVSDSFKVTPRLTLEYGLRWEPVVPPVQVSGRINSWLPGVQSTVSPGSPPGFIFPGDPQLPHGLIYSDLNNFAPRAGLSWDVTGNAKNVVRAAYGLFFQDAGGDILHANQAPWRHDFNIYNGLMDDPFGSLGLPPPPTSATLPTDFGCKKIPTYPGLACEYALPISMVYTEPHLATPYYHHFSASLQRQIGKDWAAELSYAGQIGVKLLGHNQFNVARLMNDPVTGGPPTVSNAPNRVPYLPGVLSPVSRELSNFYRMSYHGMNAKLTKRMSRGLTLQAAYTLSKNITTQSEITMGLISNVPNPLDLNAGKGPSFYDRRHSVAISWVYAPEFAASSPFLKAVVNGWSITGLHRFQTGSPLALIMGTDVAANGSSYASSAQLAQLMPGTTAPDLQRSWSSRADMVAKYFNTAAIMPPKQVPVGIYGDYSRGMIYGPAYANSDVSAMKNIPLGVERIRMQFRGEFFNIFNQVNFNNPDQNASSGTFGRITSAQPGRVAQLALKLLW